MNFLYATPAITLLVYRAWSHKSLTPLGLVAATVTAIIHALHPSPAPFILLIIFYLAGTKATKVNLKLKRNVTLSASGSGGGEDQRSHIQVLANSAAASALVLAQIILVGADRWGSDGDRGRCFSHLSGSSSDLIMIGIVGNYVAVCADTLSSELGILSSSPPRLLTSLDLRVVPRGTNGGVTPTGLLAGMGGALIIALTSGILLPFCAVSYIRDRIIWIACMTVWGSLGSILDSVLGGLLQTSVVDERTGKVIEGIGGRRVLVHPSLTKAHSTADTGNTPPIGDSMQLRYTEAVLNTVTLRGGRITARPTGSQPSSSHEPCHGSRRIECGFDLLDNNGVNMLMAATMSMGAMGIAWLSVSL